VPSEVKAGVLFTVETYREWLHFIQGFPLGWASFCYEAATVAEHLASTESWMWRSMSLDVAQHE